MERTLQTNTRPQPALRAAFPASIDMLAAAASAARNAQQIVAGFMAENGARTAATTAVPRKAGPWTEAQAIACDLRINAMKNSGAYDLARSRA